MNEAILGFQGTLALLISVIYSMLCWAGGRDKDYFGIEARIWGRFIAPLILCSLIIALSLWTKKFNGWFLLSFPAYLISHTLGYGGKSLWVKIMRRSFWSLVRTTASITFAIFVGAWTLFGLQVVIGLIAANVLGTRNPLKAPNEEGLINFLNVVFVPYMVI